MGSERLACFLRLYASFMIYWFSGCWAAAAVAAAVYANTIAIKLMSGSAAQWVSRQNYRRADCEQDARTAPVTRTAG